MIRQWRVPRASIIGARGLVAVAGGLVVLVAVAASAAWQAERNTSALERSAQTQSLRTLTAEILIEAQDAETGQRGYLLTQDPNYLAPFEQAEAALPQLLDRLDVQAAADPALLPNTAGLRQAAMDKLAELQNTVDLTASGQRDAASAIVRSNFGRERMRLIRERVTLLTQELDDRLVIEANAIRAGGRRLVAIDFTALVLVIVLASLIALGARRYLADLAAAQEVADKAHRALQANNERLDEAVRRRTADLTAANEEIQRFAYIVSHDLRAPLVNIMGFTGELEHATDVLASYAAGPGEPGSEVPALVREAAIAEIPEALRFIKASTSKMDRLINAILKLSREGRRVLTSERLDMRAMFRTLVDTMSHQAQGVEVTVGAVPDIQADRIAAEQVFGNLIDNALKYLDPIRPGRIAVTGRIEDGLARYDVSDNGRGIDQRDFERVFELFRRAGNQTVPGDGIGLAHVRALVRRMGGSIVCTSTLGVGTIFTVRLPLVGQYANEAL